MSEFRFTRPNNFPPVVKNLIIINVLVFLAQITLDNQFHITEKLMLYPVMFPQFKPYQLFTHLFAHSPALLFHIIFNMFGLWSKKISFFLPGMRLRCSSFTYSYAIYTLRTA